MNQTWSNTMRRREFIALLGGAAFGWPLAARAQQPGAMRRIGVLMAYAESDSEGQAFIAAFREGLQKLGWAEDRNIRIDTRWANVDVESMQRFAKELVALAPDLILSQNTPTTAAMLQQTRTIPIIFAIVSDPVGSGFVASFPRPGGNVSPIWSRRWPASGWSCSRRLRRALTGSPSCSTRQRRHISNIF
jgi:putative ABC transport system substrate-binding protein